MPDTDPPELNPISEKSQAEVDAEWAKVKFDRALIEMAANVIRVVRGAGRPEDIINNCMNVVKAAVEHHDTTKRYPRPYDIATTLRLEHESIEDYESYWGGKQIAIRDMISGSLQVAASTLIGQPLQVKQGEREMDRAFVGMERLREEQRAARAAAEREARKSTVAKKPASKTRRKPPIKL
jgi:hypothetical protein